MTKEDKNKLQTPIVDHDTGDYPKDALHLIAENIITLLTLLLKYQ